MLIFEFMQSKGQSFSSYQGWAEFRITDSGFTDSGYFFAPDSGLRFPEKDFEKFEFFLRNFVKKDV